MASSPPRRSQQVVCAVAPVAHLIVLRFERRGKGDHRGMQSNRMQAHGAREIIIRHMLKTWSSTAGTHFHRFMQGEITTHEDQTPSRSSSEVSALTTSLSVLATPTTTTISVAESIKSFSRRHQTPTRQNPPRLTDDSVNVSLHIAHDVLFTLMFPRY